MKDYLSYGNSRGRKIAATVETGGKSLGTLYDQKFYAIRVGSNGLRFPFEPQPFTALVDIKGDVDQDVLKSYARELLSYGCVQAVCRGVEAPVLNDIFGELAESGDIDANGFAFTSMSVDDEPLSEAIEYFVLPSGLASTGLLLVIGDAGDFKNAIEDFADMAGSLKKAIREPMYVEEELVCFC